ncbi:MAG: HepT-like ribonuclease domain-containing protein [Pseudomonas sp.]
MFKDDRVRLGHMLDASRKAVGFCQGRSRTDLEADSMLSLSLVRLLEIIGEAARTVSSESRATHPAIPWKKIIGMRDRLVHGYFDVNLDVVWETVTQDLPPLIEALEPLIAQEGTGPLP